MSIQLHNIVAAFGEKWGPREQPKWGEFISDLRDVLEAYGKAAIIHESLPDTEHEHGEPI